MKKRWLIILLIGIGLIPWFWVGSYAAFRMAGTSKLPICFITIPWWVDSLAPSYEALAQLDGKLTGSFVLIVPNSLKAPTATTSGGRWSTTEPLISLRDGRKTPRTIGK